MRNLRALVVDDSSLNRRTIAAMLAELEGISSVEMAADGAEALRIVEAGPPDFITLDLEMPGLDGYEFLHLLMDRNPIPVVVVSGRSERENVFRALELGALDFIAKPGGEKVPLEGLQRQLEEKVRIIQQLSPPALRGEAAVRSSAEAGHSRVRAQTVIKHAPSKVVVIGASTGGPRALMRLFRHLYSEIDAAVVIAQHMPPRFTQRFAERLDRMGVLRVSEARPYERLARGHAYVCPGGRCIEIVPSNRGPALRVVSPAHGIHYVPSADQLFRSAARVLGEDAIAVVLTGMGNDGSDGATEVSKRGGVVLIEAPETAVLSGMPLAVRCSGILHESLDIWALGDRIVELTGPEKGSGP